MRGFALTRPLDSRRESGGRSPARDNAGTKSQDPATAFSQWRYRRDTICDSPAADCSNSFCAHSACNDARRAATRAPGCAAIRRRPDTPRIGATMTEPVAIFPWLPSSSLRLRLTLPRIPEAGLITWRLGSPAAPKDMRDKVFPSITRTRARVSTAWPSPTTWI